MTLTPPIRYEEIEWMPRIREAEWLDHTSKMILFEWMPLTYFCFVAVLIPRDKYGCSLYAIESISNIILYVFGPTLLLRTLGIVFMTANR